MAARRSGSAVEEGGLTLPLVPEAQAAPAATGTTRMSSSRGAAAHAVPLPLAETIVGALAPGRRRRSRCPIGPITVAPTQRRATGSALARDGAAGSSAAPPARVPWGRTAKHVVVVAELTGKPTVALVAGGAAKVEPRHESRAASRATR